MDKSRAESVLQTAWAPWSRGTACGTQRPAKLRSEERHPSYAANSGTVQISFRLMDHAHEELRNNIKMFLPICSL